MPAPLSYTDVCHLAKLAEEEPGELVPKVPRLIATVKNEGRTSNDFKRRSLAAESLSLIAKDVPQEVALHVTEVVDGLERSLDREVGRTGTAFASMYAAQNRKTSFALTEILGTLARKDAIWVTQATDILLEYLREGDGEIDEALVALEAVASKSPSTIEPSLLAQCLSEPSPRRKAATARVFSKFTETDHTSNVLKEFDLSKLEKPIKHEDYDICGATVRLVSELAEFGHANAVISSIEISWLESALRHSELYPCSNATAALCTLCYEGYTSNITKELDFNLFPSLFSHDEPNVIGNTAILVGYIAEYDHGYTDELVSHLDFEDICDYLTHKSLFVRRNVVTALGYIAECGHTDIIMNNIDLTDLEPLISHTDSDVSGNAVAMLNELINGGHAEDTVDTIDLSMIEVPLQSKEPFASGNAVLTVAHLAEQGHGETTVEVIDLSLLNPLLADDDERVRSNTVAALSDLAENGFADSVVNHIELTRLEPLFDGTDTDEVANAVLTVGRLAENGHAQKVEDEIDIQKIGSLIGHDDAFVNENAALAFGVIGSNGVIDPLLSLAPRILTHVKKKKGPGRKSSMWTLAVLLRVAPHRTSDAVPNTDVLDVLLTAAEETDINYRMENDPKNLTLRTRIAQACETLAVTQPRNIKCHQKRIRKLLDPAQFILNADEGVGAPTVVNALAHLGSSVSISPPETGSLFEKHKSAISNILEK